MERLGFETPVLFECVGACALLAAAIVKDLQAARTRTAHQFPILEVIGRQVACRLVIAGIVREDLIAEIKTHHAAKNPAIRCGHCQHFAVRAKLVAQRFEIALGHGRRSVAMHIVGIQGKKTVHAAVNFTAKAVLDAFANHRALFAGYRQHIGIFFSQDFLAEGDVQILRGPVGMARVDVAELQMRNAQPFGNLLGFNFQRICGLRRGGGDTTIYRKRQRHQ